MNKREFEEAQELQKQITFKQLVVDKIRKTTVQDNATVVLNNDKDNVDLMLSKGTIAEIVQGQIDNLEREIKSMQDQFDAL